MTTNDTIRKAIIAAANIGRNNVPKPEGISESRWVNAIEQMRRLLRDEAKARRMRDN